MTFSPKFISHFHRIASHNAFLAPIARLLDFHAIPYDLQLRDGQAISIDTSP